MTIEELSALAKYDLAAFAVLCGDKNPIHLDYISEKIQFAIENPMEDKYWLILIEVPPRHGKTLRVSKKLPAWFLGRFPKKRVILTSYSDSLAGSNSDTAKENFRKYGPLLWGVNPSGSKFNKSEWETEEGGGCIAAGVGGSLTGFGADLFIIDDFIKGREDAESLLMRDKLWEWLQSVAMTRLHPGAALVIPNTRWHDDDLVGRLLKQYKEEGEEFPFKVVRINLPAEAEKDDLLGRKPGEALWPWRYNLKKLKNIAKAIGAYFYAALYQCSPVARGGNLFKSDNFRYYTTDPMTGDFLCWKKGVEDPIRINKNGLVRHCFADPALEEKKKNDPTGAAAWGYSRTHKIWLLLDRYNKRVAFTKVYEELQYFAFKNQCTLLFVENEKLGKVLVKQSAGNDRIKGTIIPVKEFKTKNLDKHNRAVPMATYQENERVFHPKVAPWRPEYEDNLVRFPNAKHDEDIDVTSPAVEMETNVSVAEALIRGGS